MFIVLIITLAYCLLMLFFIRGLNKIHEISDQEVNAQPSVSVIVPAHNEERGLATTLESLLKQDYQGDFEIICIDDRSSDSTKEILTTFALKHPQIKAVYIDPSEGSVIGNKKRAMQRGIDQSQGEVLMSIDGDCLAPPSWIRSMTKHFEEEVDIVQGPKQIIKGQDWVHGYQQLETLGFTLIEGAFFSQELPLLASAPSLAYRKSLFLASGGFSKLMAVESGDDDMLVHQMAPLARSVRYNADPEAQVSTHGVATWKQLFNQHARWASNGTEYDNKWYIAFLSLIFLFFIWLGTAPIFGFWGLPAYSWWGPLLLKMILDWIFISKGAVLLKSEKLLIHFPLVFFVQIYVILYAVPAGKWKWYKW